MQVIMEKKIQKQMGFETGKKRREGKGHTVRATTHF